VRLMPADAIQKASHEIAKTVEVNLPVVGRGQASTNLTVERFGAVSRIEVEALEFVDGPSWKAAEPGTCSFTPDGFMLIGSR
jgi:hypothetical protein